MSATVVPTYSRAQLSGWACVNCQGLAVPGVPAGRAGARQLFACRTCAEPEPEIADCVGCERWFDEDDLTPDHNGDLSCSDCRSTWAGLDDVAEWRWWAYAA